jgi:predicted transcriptional regulator
MSKTNVTLKIDTRLLKKVKILAAQQETSISALLTAALEEQVGRDDGYEQAKRRALANMGKGFDSGGRPLTREEIYER